MQLAESNVRRGSRERSSPNGAPIEKPPDAPLLVRTFDHRRGF